MKPDFLIAYKNTGGNEGHVLTNDKNDTGLLSYAGISSKWFPAWEGWQIIKEKNIPIGETCPGMEQMVQDFYFKNFWIPSKCDTLDNQDLANQVYDMAVNSSVAEALKLLS